jgi:hypothetical protein
MIDAGRKIIIKEHFLFICCRLVHLFYENTKPMDVDTLTHMELMEQMVELGTRVMI